MKNKLLYALGILIILSSCGKKMDFNKEESVKTFLSENTIFLAGDMEFFDNGTFCLTPQSSEDPTQYYVGSYTLGECKNCDKDYASKLVTITFNTTGWVTDDHQIDGAKFSGFGSTLEGKIVTDSDKENKTGYKIEFKSNSSGGLVWDSNAGSEGGFVASSKKFERSFKKKTDEQLTRQPPVIESKKSNVSASVNEPIKSAVEKIEEFTLISGSCHEDGCTFIFQNSQQKEIISSSIPDNILEFDETEEGGTTVKDKYLNKKYTITYKTEVIHHQASNTDDEEIVIIKMK